MTIFFRIHGVIFHTSFKRVDLRQRRRHQQSFPPFSCLFFDRLLCNNAIHKEPIIFRVADVILVAVPFKIGPFTTSWWWHFKAVEINKFTNLKARKISTFVVSYSLPTPSIIHDFKIQMLDDFTLTLLTRMAACFPAVYLDLICWIAKLCPFGAKLRSPRPLSCWWFQWGLCIVRK